MSAPFGRLIGMDFDGAPLYAPKPSHSLLTASAGSWKTTAGAMTWLLSLVGDTSRAIVVNDCKDGEIAAQAADMCHRYGRKVAIIDDFGVLGEDNPYRISISPFNSLQAAKERGNGDLIFAAENANHALIPEPADGDQKNLFFRDRPRAINEYIESALLKRKVALATPGGVWSMASDPDLLLKAAKIDAEEGDTEEEEDEDAAKEAAELAALARDVIDMSTQEQWGMHRSAAVRALRIYSAGSPLHHAGRGATITHSQLLREKYVVFIVGPQRHMARLGPHYALHLQCFIDALMSDAKGQVDFILDEATNAPLKALISALTTMRGFGGNCHFIVQSRSELKRAYGENETATIEDNAVVKQYFGFSSFEEAERISRAMGETQVISKSLGYNTRGLDLSGNIGTNKDRVFPAEMLMRLPPDEAITHIKDVGFIHHLKLQQHQTAPFCHGELADNPHEGPQRSADPRVTIDISKRAAA